jgi:streptogramin lyase
VAAGVTVSLTGASSASTVTDLSGNYSFGSLANGNYTLTASLGGYHFSPTSLAVTVSGAAVVGQNFTSTANTYSISGTVSGAVTSGVTVSLTGAASASTITDLSGNYSFGSIANGSYVLTPSLSGYAFSPANLSVSLSGANATGQEFTAFGAYPIRKAGVLPSSIITGPDGNLWFAEYCGNALGRLTPEGTLTESFIPTPSAGPEGIVVRPVDGLRIGRITPAGVVTLFRVPGDSAKPYGITSGPATSLWFVDQFNGVVYRFID